MSSLKIPAREKIFPKTMVAEMALTSIMNNYEAKQEMIRNLEEGSVTLIDKRKE